MRVTEMMVKNTQTQIIRGAQMIPKKEIREQARAAKLTDEAIVRMMVEKPEIGTRVFGKLENIRTGEIKVVDMTAAQWIVKKAVEETTAKALIMSTRFYTVDGEDYHLGKEFYKLYDKALGWFNVEVVEKIDGSGIILDPGEKWRDRITDVVTKGRKKIAEEVDIINSLRKSKSFKENEEDCAPWEVELKGVPTGSIKQTNREKQNISLGEYSEALYERRPYVGNGWMDYIVANRGWSPEQDTGLLYNMVWAIALCSRSAYVATPLDTPMIDDDMLLVSKVSDKPYDETFRVVRFNIVGTTKRR